MMKVLFFIWCLLMDFQAWAQTPVEIYAKGDKYDSLQAYKASEEKSASGKILLKTGAWNSRPKVLSDSTRHKLYVLSVEKGVERALISSAPVSRIIPADQIQEAIKTAVTASSTPKLLISRPGKVRIMTMTTDDARK